MSIGVRVGVDRYTCLYRSRKGRSVFRGWGRVDNLLRSQDKLLKRWDKLCGEKHMAKLYAVLPIINF